MNTVLDDNKMLCLANSERIKLSNTIHMVFEVSRVDRVPSELLLQECIKIKYANYPQVQDLAQASPATVSRCGMVYVDPGQLKWMPYVKTWLDTLSDKLRRETRCAF